MNQSEIAGFIKALAPTIGDFVSRAIEPFKARLKLLEERQPIKGDKGDTGAPGADGRDGAPGERGADGTPGRDGVDGKDGAPGADGRDGAPGERGADGAPGRDGVDGKDGAPGGQGERGEKGDAGRDGRDASDLAVLRELAADLVAKGIAAAMATLSVSTPDDGRTLVIEVKIGEAFYKSEVVTATIIDRGVWKEAREGGYQKGDGVSWGGSFFIAQLDTSDKPETSDAWRLAVKRGRNGRDGDPGKDGPQGPQGPKGDRGFPGART